MCTYPVRVSWSYVRVTLSKGFIVTEQRFSDDWNRFIADLERAAPDQRYQHHPDQTSLLEYLKTPTPSVDEARPPAAATEDFDAWLQGAQGWSSSTISMHVLTCRICRRRLDLLRQEQLVRTDDTPATPWWKPMTDAIGHVLPTPRVRWAATIGVIAFLFFSLTLSLLPGNPPGGEDPPPLPFERHEPRGGGIG